MTQPFDGIKVGDKIVFTQSDYPFSVPNGSVMTVVDVFDDGVAVGATIDGGDGFAWFVDGGTYEKVIEQPEDEFYIKFVEEKDNKDGTVMVTFDLGGKAKNTASELGLKMMLYMAALNLSPEQAFETLWNAHSE